MINRILASVFTLCMIVTAVPAAAAETEENPGILSDFSCPFVISADAASTAQASFEKKTMTITAGEKHKLKIKWTKGKHKKLKFWVKDKNLLKMSKKGMIQGLHPGTTVIVLKNKDGKKSQIDITINEPADMNNQVYLTFDDGPGSEITPKLLDVLKANGVKATFFVIGKNAEKNKDILKRAAKEGHTIAIHTYSHDYHQIYASEDAFLQDFHATEKVIKDVTGKKPRYFRFPGGSNNCYMSVQMKDDILSQLHSEGYTEMDWNAMTGDASGRPYGVEQMVHIGLDSRFGRGPVVILSHDENSKKLTPDVTNALISSYKAKGAVFRNLDEYYGPEMCLQKEQ